PERRDRGLARSPCDLAAPQHQARAAAAAGVRRDRDLGCGWEGVAGRTAPGRKRRRARPAVTAVTAVGIKTAMQPLDGDARHRAGPTDRAATPRPSSAFFARHLVPNVILNRRPGAAATLLRVAV